ncbi:MAG: FHA domain-containing protein [Bacteroidales bacterium]|nr:FHA domain-containing protein [Bacteroidales bacterium]
MNDTLHIGRGKENHLVVKDEKVSSNHCCIKKLSANEFIVEDLGSSNGTFLNGKRIMRAALTETHTLCLASYAVEPKFILSSFDHVTLKKGVAYEDLIKQEHIFHDFANLKMIYDQYQKEKRRIMKSNTLKSTGLRAGLSFIPVVGVALGILSTGVTGNVQEQLMELEETFKRNYICPGCFKFLGAEPFENMEKRGFCHACKTKWKRKPIILK